MGIFQKERDLNRSPDRVELVVDGSFFRLKSEEVLVRLDQFLLAHLHWRSRTSIQALIREGQVDVDAAAPDQAQGSGTPSVERRPGRKLRHGSRVVVHIPPHLRLPEPEGDVSPVQELYSEPGVLVVDKPPHVPVHPSGRHVLDTMIQRVHAHCARAMEELGEAPRLCHRLDRETSGVLLIGTRPRHHRSLRKQFERHGVRKFYQALVWGALAGEEGSIRWPIGPDRHSPVHLKMTVTPDGQECRTDWKVLRRLDGYTLVECELFTGRQHQIRVHLAALGHPVVGDKLYGPDELLFLRAAEGTLDEADLRLLELDRHALHHHRLIFESPNHHESVTVESPLAADLQAFMDSLSCGSQA
ncbi:MAG: RluA family pseudouridine synthase [Planctomycetes bacterium]|nr:RluA family pseudouridine synthase [Planctomycetota bacterium]MCB9909870.1 RluA family pseudouridine synthase [Planctomycetota bacterium]MCB9913390.1 RluA family pseudouridine synthase [Planctomycetota bacterium]